MIAARLKHQIEIWGKTKAKSTIGSIVESEALAHKIKADVQTSMGRVVANDDRVIHTTETTFIIRNWPDVTYNNFIMYGGDKYRIVAIQPLPDQSGQIIKTVRNG